MAPMWSAAVFDPALPGRSTMASGSPAPSAPWSANTARGWNPNVFFHVGAACSFSEHAVTIVASMSTVTSAPSAPGAASPASAQARSRAAARAARIAFSARGASAASALISRDTTGSEATGPNRSGWRGAPRHRPGSPRPAPASRPGRDDLPGSCTARGARHRASPAHRPCVQPVTRSVWVSSSAPAWDTIPFPSADTVILGWRAVFFTG